MTNKRFVVFDVETPNYANDRMSAIGISVVEDGIITEKYFSLINPESRFDSFNVYLTGITPEMVEDKPNFSQLWEIIEPIMADGILVAHSAPFDMSVLSKCLKAYSIEWKPYALYACTVQMGRACYPCAPNHKLDTLCDYLGIELDHHKADSDSLAAAQLLIDYINNGIDVNRFIRRYKF